MENGCQVDRLPPPYLASEGVGHLNAKGQNGRSLFGMACMAMDFW